MVVGSSRPRLGREVVRVAVGVALLAFFGSILACGMSGESTLIKGSDRPPSEPALSSGGAAMAGGEGDQNVCAPVLGGLVPAAITPLEVRCPAGYDARDPSRSLPIAGRFSSAEELVKAYCVRDGLPPKLTLQEHDAIDFEANDVVAFAYDVKAGGVPMLFRRGAELWLQTNTDTCTGLAPSLASVAYVIPKHVVVNEQTCTRSCE